MKLLDFYAVQSMLQPGEMLRLAVEIESSSAMELVADVAVYHLAEVVARAQHTLSIAPGKQRVELIWQPPEFAPCGYGFALQLLDATGRVAAVGTTAVDVLHKWTEYPRYGFLTDFTPGRADARETAMSLARYHINGLQFYDWQFRHDQLLPPTEQFVDPLGRSLSLATVQELLHAAHEMGMAGMPYLAIYAASLDYAQAHPEQALYDESGQTLTFEGFLGIMDPAAGSLWTAHLLRQCDEILAALPFDGHHVDQYGEPKIAYDESGNAVDLPAAFVDFMGALKRDHPHKTAVFNAVGNWPIDALATGPQDFLYIEIWPPATGYRDIWDIVAGARRKSGGKPVVIALYLNAEHEANICLADALIYSVGATRIEIGEQDRLLSDPYFPKHQPISVNLRNALRRYADFAVRYGEWLGPAAADLDPVSVSGPASVWAIPRRAGEWHIVNLVNMSDLGSTPSWDQAHPYPTPLTAIPVTVAVDGQVEEVYWASPDSEQPDLAPLAWRQEGRFVTVELPALAVWSLLALRLGTSA